MGYFKSTGIIFDTKPTGEHDKYLELILEDGRRISAKIRKARHTKSKWGAVAEPVTVAKFELYEKQNRFTVTGISSQEQLLIISNSFEKAIASKYVAEMITGTTPYDISEPGTFEITLDVFKKINESKNVLVTVNEFLAEIINAAGYPIETRYCLVCGDEIKGDCRFSIAECSTICENCSTINQVKFPGFAREGLSKICGCEGDNFNMDKKLLLGLHELLERIIYTHFNFKPRTSLHLRSL